MSSVSILSSNKDKVLILLLGASNLSRAYSGLVSFFKLNLVSVEVKVLAAFGSGRAYSTSAGMLNIVYPPLSSCTLFDEAERVCQHYSRVVALVTDIGNDIMYNVPQDRIVEDLECVLSRLALMQAEIHFTPIPKHLENNLGEKQFFILRALSYPRSRQTWKRAIASMRGINRFLSETCQGPAHLVTGLESFAGFDGIHYSYFEVHKAWTHIGGAMLNSMGYPVRRKIRSIEMLTSLADHGVRTYLSDMLSLVPKAQDLY